MDEQESASCSVSLCAVTRNTLPRWRRAAMEHFEWPASLPVTLHTARTFAQRVQWAAELDMDPGQVPTKMCVCSFHFTSGRPTEDDPLPSVLLK